MFVYFIQGQSTRLVKIGITRGNVYSRLATIQANSPDTLKLLKAVKGDSKYESELHKRFASVRSHGEWFYPSRGLMAFIQSLDDVKIKKIKKPNKRENTYMIIRKRRKERAQEIQEMYLEGASRKAIAEKLKVSDSTVHSYIKGMSQKRKETLINNIAELHATGKTCGKIAKALGISIPTVKKYIKGKV